MPIVLESEIEQQTGGGGGLGDDMQPGATPAASPEPASGITVEGDAADAEGAATTFGQGVVAGAARGAAATAGIVGGAKVGALAGTAVAPGVGTIAGGITGGAIGGLAGIFAGDTIQRGLAEVELPGGTKLTFGSMEQVPLPLRKYAVAGETFGATIPFMGLPYAAARNGFRFANNLPGRFFNRVIEGAYHNPASFAMIELQSGFSAGVAGGIAEDVDPGDELTRFGAEIVGGTLNPARWIMTGARQIARTARTAYNHFFKDPTAGETGAALELARIMDEFGEDPRAVAQAIREGMVKFPGVNLSAGLTSGSPALIALEGKLATESAKFGAASRQMAEDGLTAMKGLLHSLEQSGDPQALRAAARVRSDYFTSLLSTRLHNAEAAALEAAGNINPSNARSRSAFGVRVNEIMTEALDDVRAVEAERWGQVAQDLPGRADGLLARIGAIRSQRLPEEPLPAIVTGFERRMLDSDAVTTSGELILLRSRMLKQSREAAGQNRWDDARVFGEMAEAALEDMNRLLIGKPEQRVAYESAREWSRQLNDTFMRTFASDALAVDKAGATRIPPELVMNRAFSTGRELGDLQFRELEEAARMAGQEHVTRLLDQQERTIRFAAGQVIDGNTGRINPARLERFNRDNADLLNRFPEIRDQLTDATAAERLLRQTERAGKRGQQIIREQAAFSKLAANEDPATVVGQAVTGANPMAEFQRLAQLARRGGPDAVAGLKSSVHAFAYQRATTAGGNFNFATYQQTMREPLITGGPSLMELMQGHGLANAQDLALMNRFLDRASVIEQAISRGGPQLDAIIADGDAMMDLAVRMAGARGAAMLPTGGAHGLIVGGAGVRFAQQVMSKIPKGRTKQMLMEIVQNPAAMAAMLEKPQTQAHKARIALQLNAFMYSWIAQEDD
jgi:hypothetical protein